MSIARIPNRKQKDIHSEDEFIEAAGAVSQAGSGGRKARKISIMLRIDPDLLVRIDRRAKESGLNRSAWIHHKLHVAAEEPSEELGRS